MPLDPRDLNRLSRLLDAALDLPASALDAWFDALPAVDRPLLPRLREMLAVDRASLTGFLSTGPSLDAEIDDGRPNVGEAVGPYRLIRAIASGGMGDVWLAERADGTLKREVALKLPRLAWGAGLAERMGRERDIGALLEHPHIARLYDAGVDARGRPYLAFEYIEGDAIDRWCDAHRLTVRARLRLFLQVAQAVAHAHGRLVVHRDLKPSNVLVGADGQARLLDFGIAKLIAETPAGDDQLTRRMGRMLTPAYASPEQIRDEPLTVESDVYSLGVVLHELLTGSLPSGRGGVRPFEPTATADVARPSRVDLTDEAAIARGCDSPKRLASLLSGDLDTIVLKAIRPVPDERYRSVERFADDIQRYLDYLPIAAKPPSLAHRLGLFARRHRPAISMAAVGSAMAVVLGVLLWQQHARTVAQSARADAVRDFMLDMVEDVEPDQAHAGHEVTGREMVLQGLHRARDRFKSEPRLLGEVLSELYRLLARLSDDASDRHLLVEAFDLLKAHAPPNDSVLNTVRAQLAQDAFEHDDLAQAESMASASLERCDTKDPPCAKVRAYANAVLGMIDGRRGRVAGYVDHERRVVVETEAGFGPDNPETAMAWYSLAVAARRAGQSSDAQAAIDRAQTIAQRNVLKARDAALIAQMRAVLAQDQGLFDEARQAIESILASTQDRNQRAELQRSLAGIELAQGEPAEASGSAEAALATAVAIGDTQAALALRQLRARALGLQDRVDDALSDIDAVISALDAAGDGADATARLRARRTRIEVMVRGRRVIEAQALLAPLLDDYRSTTDVPVIETAELLELKGCIERIAGQPSAAIASHEAARALLLPRLPVDHPLLQRNDFYLATAEWLAQPSTVASDRIEAASRVYLHRFPVDSCWRRLVAEQLAAWKASPVSTSATPMVL